MENNEVIKAFKVLEEYCYQHVNIFGEKLCENCLMKESCHKTLNHSLGALMADCRNEMQNNIARKEMEEQE